MGRAAGEPNGGEIRSYRDLRAWQRAMDLVEAIYQTTANWPQRETYGLAQQIRRAAVSVPSNIAEGQGRRGRREYVHALSIANGSLYEVETQLLVAQRLRYLPEERCAALLEETAHVGRLPYGLIRRLQNPLPPAASDWMPPADDPDLTTDD